jgi:drug/metabolite transporter (DMT)-like permease
VTYATTLWHRFIPAMPVVFVFLWSSAFVGVHFGLPYAEPFTFLAWRFLLAASIFLLVAWRLRSRWPSHLSDYVHIIFCGVLIHGIYLGGVFEAVYRGVPVGVCALILGTQPLITAVLVRPFVGEKVSQRQWLGFIGGALGVALVVTEQLDVFGRDLFGMGLCLMSVVAISIATIYQKRYCSEMDLGSGAFLQFLAAGILMLLLSFLLESGRVEWSGEFLFALTWLVLIVSLGAMTLLWVMVKQNAAVNVASLFFLVPPLALIMMWLLFDETLGLQAIAGMIIIATSVAIITRAQVISVK